MDFHLFDDVLGNGRFLERGAAVVVCKIDGSAGLDIVKGLVPLDVIGDGGSAGQNGGEAEKP